MIRQKEIKALKEILSADKDNTIKISRSFLEDIVDFFEKQPTSYDVDKIVEQLEDEKYKVPECEYDKGVNDMCDVAIKIVKAGGVHE